MILQRIAIARRNRSRCAIICGANKGERLTTGVPPRLDGLLVLAAAASMALLAPAPAQADRSQILINAAVLTHVSLSGVQMPSQVAITDEDLARGYLEIAQPVTIDVRSNTPSGLVLGFTLTAAWVTAAQVRRAQDGVSGSTGAASLLVPKEGKGLAVQSVALRVRLILGQSARAGTFAWPLAVVVAPA